MIAASVEPRPWSGRRWCLLLGLVFTGQLGLIFRLSDHAPMPVRQPARAPTLRLAGNASAELLALNDPTLFALPHRQGFSGPAWLTIPSQQFRPFDWNEAPDWLPLPVGLLGATYRHFIATNRFDFSFGRVEPEPDLTLPELYSPTTSVAQSSWRLEGVLAQRRLRAPLHLPVWPYTNILANTVIQIMVDAEGRPVSGGAVLSGSGRADVDRYALDQARAARFEPMEHAGADKSSNPLAAASFGKMIFEWHTVPLPSTNAPPGSPLP